MSEIPPQRTSPEIFKQEIDNDALSIWAWVLTDDTACRDIIDREEFVFEWMSVVHCNTPHEVLKDALIRAEEQILDNLSNN